MSGKLFTFILILFCGHIGFVWTQDYNYDDYYEDYVDAHSCNGWTEHFCSSTDRCNNASEPCDGQCGGGYHFCPSNDSCLKSSEPCDGQCGYPYYFKPSNDTCIKCKDYEYFCSSTDMCINTSESCDGQCVRFNHFCPSTDSCIFGSIPCDGNCPDDRPNLCDNETLCYPNSWINDSEYDCTDRSDEYWPICGFNYHFCPSNDSCLHNSKACDGQCKENYYFCPSTDSCINDETPCDGNCPEDLPNICDNGTFCYPTHLINDGSYTCADRSDEHRPTEESPPLDNFSMNKFLQLNTGLDEDGYPGVDCQDGTVHGYRWWCKEELSRMCGGVSTNDYFICHNSSLWRDRPCGVGYLRGCKVPGKCFWKLGKCIGQVGNYFHECGASDYSNEVCPVNKDKLKEHTKYFRCNDNSSLIHPTLVCDGFKHCDDLSDENECDICPRVNNMVVHGQMVQLKAEEMKDLTHLKSTAIMRCESPYGRYMCATPGDGVPECARKLKEGLWQTQDELELTSATLWRTIFKYMSYIFLVSVVVLFKITQLGYLCQKPIVDVPVLTTYRRMIAVDTEPKQSAIPMISFTSSESLFPTPFFTTTEPVQLTHQFRQYYIQNHTSEHFGDFFNFCLTLSQFLPSRMERDIFHCGIYALEAQIHGMSPACTDRCLKQHSSDALEPMFDAVYGSFSDRFPNAIKNLLFNKDKLPSLNYLWRIKIFIFRYFFFYFDIVQEYVLLSFILGTAGLGISTTTWLEEDQFDYIHILVYLYIVSVFLPIILFALQLSFSSQIGIIFGVKKPLVGQRVFFGFCCFILSPFIPTVLFFRIEKHQLTMFNLVNNTSKELTRLSNDNVGNSEHVNLKNKIFAASKFFTETHSEIIEAKSLYKQFKEWELAIELPIQTSLTIIFSFMKKSTTVVNQIFRDWFISDTKSLIILVGMSLRSIIAMQISDESARKNNFLGIKSKMFLAPLYMTTSIPRIASIVIYAAVPLGLMDLLGHWTVERKGNEYSLYFHNSNLSHLNERMTDCSVDNGYNVTEDSSYLNSTLFSVEVSYTKYTAWTTPTYMALLMVVLASSVIFNFVWLSVRSRKSLSEKILSSAKSVLSITLDSDFDEDDESMRPEQLHLHYKRKFNTIHKEYILKLLLYTGTNMALTFPWALAYQAANKRHQVLTAIGDCYGVKGTVEMEDISLERLWWGQWVLPLLMAVLGFLNYGLFRLYVKYGHPWRRLLTPDDERIEEWRTLKLWEILENQNDYGGDVEIGNNLNIQEAVSGIPISYAGRDVVVSEDVIVNQDGDSAKSEEEFQEERFNLENEIDEVLDDGELQLDRYCHRENQDDAIYMKDELNRENIAKNYNLCNGMVGDEGEGVLLEVKDLHIEKVGDSGERGELYNLSLKGNDRDINEKVVIEKVHIGCDIYMELIHDDGNKVAEEVKENATLGIDHSSKKLYEDENMEEKTGKENRSIAGDFYVRDTFSVEVLDVREDKREEILKGTLEQEDDGIDGNGEKKMSKEKGDKESNDRGKREPIHIVKEFTKDDFYEDLLFHGREKENVTHKANIKQENDDKDKEEDILIKNVSKECNFYIRIVVDNEDGGNENVTVEIDHNKDQLYEDRDIEEKTSK